MSARLDKEPRVVDIYLSFLLMRPYIPAVLHVIFLFFCHVPSQYSNKLCGYARSHYSQRSSIYGCCDHLQAQRISITF